MNLKNRLVIGGSNLTGPCSSPRLPIHANYVYVAGHRRTFGNLFPFYTLNATDITAVFAKFRQDKQAKARIFVIKDDGWVFLRTLTCEGMYLASNSAVQGCQERRIQMFTRMMEVSQASQAINRALRGNWFRNNQTL